MSLTWERVIIVEICIQEFSNIFTPNGLEIQNCSKKALPKYTSVLLVHELGPQKKEQQIKMVGDEILNFFRNGLFWNVKRKSCLCLYAQVYFNTRTFRSSRGASVRTSTYYRHTTYSKFRLLFSMSIFHRLFSWNFIPVFEY